MVVTDVVVRVAVVAGSRRVARRGGRGGRRVVGPWCAASGRSSSGNRGGRQVGAVVEAEVAVFRVGAVRMVALGAEASTSTVDKEVTRK